MALSINNNNKYKLAMCSIFNPKIYGVDENSTPGIETHYIVIYLIDIDEFYNNEYIDILDLINREQMYLYRVHNQCPHPIIRNYNAITNNTIKLDIVKCDELTGQECVGYVKTFWLKIVQRRWKKVFKERNEMLKARSSLAVLKERQQTGQWPKHLRQWPKFTLNLVN